MYVAFTSLNNAQGARRRPCGSYIPVHPDYGCSTGHQIRVLGEMTSTLSGECFCLRISYSSSSPEISSHFTQKSLLDHFFAVIDDLHVSLRYRQLAQIYRKSIRMCVWCRFSCIFLYRPPHQSHESCTSVRTFFRY